MDKLVYHSYLHSIGMNGLYQYLLKFPVILSRFRNNWVFVTVWLTGAEYAKINYYFYQILYQAYAVLQ